MPVHIGQHHKKRSLRGALRGIVRDFPLQELVQPLIHINCHGAIQIENCSRILEYDEQRIRLATCGNTVTVEGQELTICVLNAHITEIRGRIFRLDLLEEEN